MKTAKYALGVVLALAITLMPRAVRADDIAHVTISNLVGSGNPFCGLSGQDLCTETLNATFEWDNSTLSYVNGSASASVSGDMGSTVAGFGAPTDGGGAVVDFVVFLDSAGDQFDVSLIPSVLSGVLTPGSYAVGPFDELGCQVTSSCAGKFVTFFNPIISGTISVTVTSTSAPEPSVVASLVTGLFCLSVFAILRKRVAWA